jgi:hypothetical protein
VSTSGSSAAARNNIELFVVRGGRCNDDDVTVVAGAEGKRSVLLLVDGIGTTIKPTIDEGEKVVTAIKYSSTMERGPNDISAMVDFVMTFFVLDSSIGLSVRVFL